MGRPKKYSDEFRRRAIDEVLERGRKVGALATESLPFVLPGPLSAGAVRVGEQWSGKSHCLNGVSGHG